MTNLFLIIFIFISVQVFGQYDYELFQQYADKRVKQNNIKLNTITELQLQDDGKWVKTAFQQFNTQGLPVTIIQYDQQAAEGEKKEFIYNMTGQISKIETYKGGNHFGSAEFEVDTSGQISSYIDYGYSSSSGEKMFLWKTYLEYNQNQTIKKTIKVEGDEKDTTQINFYDTLGIPTKSLLHQGGLRTTKIEFIWNKDKTEMKELEYENDTAVYSTIIHKYKDNKEFERLDSSTSPQPFYWKYDNKGRLIETNEALFYVLYLIYDDNDRIIKKTMNVLFSDSTEKDLPKKFQFKYEYQFRN